MNSKENQRQNYSDIESLSKKLYNEGLQLEINESHPDDIFDFDELERSLESEIEDQMGELGQLKEDFQKIGTPEAIGSTIADVIWEQFINQIGVVAGEDFIKENRGLKLDLSKDAHIQTTENFENGKIATHNTEIDYKKRYDDWQNNFARENGDPNGMILTRYDQRSGEYRPILRRYDSNQPDNYNKNYDARGYIDEGRPTGSASVHKDHTIPAAEIIRDAEANAHLPRDVQAPFANSEINLVDLDSSANESKRDSSMTEWLDSERNGQRPADRFNIDEKELRERDKKAREGFNNLKEDGKKRSIEKGNESRKQEAFRIGGKALRSAIMALLADLAKNIIQKMIKWLKSAKKSLDSFISSIKEAIHSFVVNLKKTLLNIGNSVGTTIATAIFGPIVDIIKKVWIFLKQGYASIKDAIKYLTCPEHKPEPLSLKMLNVGKIIIGALTAGGAIVLGDGITKGLMAIPVFVVQIPIIGSLASILGIFFGAIIAGIIGALALHLIDKAIANKQKKDNIKQQLEKGNEILKKQGYLITVTEEGAEKAKKITAHNVRNRHDIAEGVIRKAAQSVLDNSKEIFGSNGEASIKETNSNALDALKDDANNI